MILDITQDPSRRRKNQVRVRVRLHPGFMTETSFKSFSAPIRTEMSALICVGPFRSVAAGRACIGLALDCPVGKAE